MRVIFYIILAYVVYRIAKGLLPPMRVKASYSNGSGGTGASEPQAEETVLDPVCGSYLSKELAVIMNKGGKAVYFCSEECRDKFTSDGGA